MTPTKIAAAKARYNKAVAKHKDAIAKSRLHMREANKAYEEWHQAKICVSE